MTKSAEDDDLYFEDDSEYDGYPGCSTSAPQIEDPLQLLNPSRLDGRYEGAWPHHDELVIQGRPDDSKVPAVAHINNRRVPLRRRTDLYDYADALSYLPSSRENRLPFIDLICPHCASDHVSVQFAAGISRSDGDDDSDDLDESDEKARVQALEFCPYCRYWRWHDLDVFSSTFDGVTHSYTGALSKVQEFAGRLPDGFASEFVQWLRRNDSKWPTVEPRSLERLVRDVMRTVYHPCEAIHVGRPDDGGVDVMLIESNGKKWVIQVKRREKSRVGESVTTVRNLLGTMVLNDKTHGMIFSTADHFTERACQAVEAAEERGFFIKLVDKGKLNRMLDAVLPDKPWLPFLQKRYPKVTPEIDAAIDLQVAKWRARASY